jgi:tetratricopeptide (TPR) repeat protein/predicted Ser/Thr protein kinase
MSTMKRCKACGNPVDPEQAKAQDETCPWCLAAFTFGPEAITPPVAAEETTTRFGKYVRTEKLGSGGMGEVWKALDTELNRWVALKFLKADDPKDLARFKREAQMAASLSHPNIAAVYEVGEIEGRQYIAMQCVNGLTMDSFPRKDRALLIRLCRDAARALDHAHRHRVIHRDVKPGNLMVEQTEEGWRVVVLDFGLARPIEGGEKLSMSGSIGGTAVYMSPEQARGGHLDRRADVYSLGASLYEILTGRPPFEGNNAYEVLKAIENSEPPRPRKLDPLIHRDLDTIVLKCLEKDRNRRYDSARELAEELDRFLSHEPIRARPPSTLYRLRMNLAKRKAFVASAGVAVAALAALLIAWTVHWKPQQDQARLYRDGMTIREEMLRLSVAPQVDRERLRRKAAEARSLFEQANAAVETSESHVSRGRCFQVEGKPAEALAAFERAHALRPDDAECRIELARALLLEYQELRTPTMKVWYFGSGRQSHEAELKPESPAARKLRERAEPLLRDVTAEGEKLDLLQGLLSVGRGEYSKAGELLARHNKIDGLDLQALHLEAWSRFLAQDLGGSIQAWDRLMAIAPTCNDLLWLGLARHQTGDLKGAVADYTRIIELDPKYESAYEHRGFTRHVLEDHKGALSDYNKLIELRPNDSSAYGNRAVVRRDLGDAQGAMTDHDKAIALNPRVSACYIDRGGTRFDLKDYEGALADVNRGLELDPTQGAGYSIRGQVRHEMGDLDGAIADFTKAMELEPTVKSHPTDRGHSKRTKGDFRGAIADFSKSIEIDPGYVRAYYNRGQAQFDLQDLTAAAADFTKLIEMNPRDAYALHMRGEVRAEMDDLKGAVADWTRSLEAAPPDAKVLRDHLEGHLVEARQYSHRWAELTAAKKEFQRVMQLSHEKQYERALEGFKKIAEAFPKSEYGMVSTYNTACVYALMGQSELALDWLEKSMNMGYREIELMKKDTDLDSLRGEPRFLKLLDRLAPR